MNTWLKVMVGAVVLGLLWAALWAGAGKLIGIADPGGVLNAFWLGPPIGLHPGFVGGVAFALLLAVASRARRFDQLPLLTVVACGALVGIGLGLLPFAINQPPAGSPELLVAGVVVGSMILMSVISAAGSLALARGARALKH